jgi:hypothetical protein
MQQIFLLIDLKSTLRVSTLKGSLQLFIRYTIIHWPVTHVLISTALTWYLFYVKLSRMNWTNSFITSGRTEYKSPCLTVPLLFSSSVFIRCHGNVLSEPLPSNGLLRGYSFQREHVLMEPLASNGIAFWLHYSSFQASCHNILVFLEKDVI